MKLTMEYEIQQSLPHKLLLNSISIHCISHKQPDPLFKGCIESSMTGWCNMLSWERYKTLGKHTTFIADKIQSIFVNLRLSMKRMRSKSLFSIMNVSLVWIDYIRNGCSIIHYRDRLMTRENVTEQRVCKNGPYALTTI